MWEGSYEHLPFVYFGFELFFLNILGKLHPHCPLSFCGSNCGCWSQWRGSGLSASTSASTVTSDAWWPTFSVRFNGNDQFCFLLSIPKTNGNYNSGKTSNWHYVFFSCVFGLLNCLPLCTQFSHLLYTRWSCLGVWNLHEQRGGFESIAERSWRWEMMNYSLMEGK